ncbi:MAG TPA: hypothetical protein VG672_20045 [Bryobacteraceae bacterium]|nr:hypothetical protein [Bryobacteraceae bacterium]HWB99016.1 hypothetical protein [Bryobacteraceae bacterium]
MTKVQRFFQTGRALDETLMEQIAQVNSIYGIEHVKVEPSGRLMVEYDATRLNTAQLEGILERAGISVREVASA